MLDNTRLRIAMQKSGRLSDDSRELLARCGIKINLHTQRLIAMAENMPIDILRVRDDDIPGLVMDGVVDLGIIGENVLEEELLNRRAQGEDPRYFTLRRLDFGGCRLSLATPVDEAWDGPAALNGKRIATSYPHLLKRYLDQKGVSFKSCLLNGSVEVAPRAGLADAICDLVSTGATLEANGLREVEVIYRSKACLIQRDGEMADAKQQLIDKLLTRIQGVIQARESKYIMMHAPSERLDEVIALLPGAERPTILPLAGDQQRVAMHMVSSETLFWETMEKLKALGASSILVLPIEDDGVIAMSFNTLIDWNSCSPEQQRELLMRPAISASESISRTVAEILENVKNNGDRALREYSAKFDKTEVGALRVTEEEIQQASSRLSDELKQAMQVAVRNIDTFHTAQILPPVDIETQPGVRCQQVTRPIASVGLYIPGGSAPLFSTVLMLATPARIAGCKKVVLCSPPPIADEILYAAQLCGVKEVFNVGGAQAIAALALGTESIPKVDKIFGPGNAYVTEAKRQVSQRLDGAAIDMPAGPSEVLVIADSGATPDFVASDLLSQAEHGPDSQVILLTPDATLAEGVAKTVERQLAELSRAETARQALSASRLIIAKDLAQCVAISNAYGPEHLIIQTRNARELVDEITSAGSVFLGDWSPESAGDYASGTNHVLPTYGYTATCSSLGLADFQKRMTVQELTPQGFSALAATIETLAAAELLTAHKNAVTLRVNALKEQA